MINSIEAFKKEDTMLNVIDSEFKSVANLPNSKVAQITMQQDIQNIIMNHFLVFPIIVR